MTDPVPPRCEDLINKDPLDTLDDLIKEGKILGKKFRETSKFVWSTRIWSHTIPTSDCDVLMILPSSTQTNTLTWLLSRMKSHRPDLCVNVRHHDYTGSYGFYLTSNYDGLLHGAEKIQLRKQMKAEFGGGLKEFNYENAEMFLNVEDELIFFTSQERQAIVLNMIENLRAEEGDELNRVKFIPGQAIIPKLITKGVISQLLPLHSNDDLNNLKQTWVSDFFTVQPLDKIHEYFGVKIAMYFAWLGHYTMALILPAVFAFLLWLLFDSDQRSQDLKAVIFAVFNVFWATFYLESWKRRSAELAYRWGTLDSTESSGLIEEPRALFVGELRRSEITGQLEPFYPPWKRNMFICFVTVPTILMCLFIVFATMIICFEIQEWVNSNDPGFITAFMPKILLAILVTILGEVYQRIALILNNLENYRVQKAYDNHLIIKLVLFHFFNSFLALFYISFYLRDMSRLQEYMAALLITRQVIGNVKETMVPHFLDKFKVYKMAKHCHQQTGVGEKVSQLSSLPPGGNNITDRLENEQLSSTTPSVINEKSVMDIKANVVELKEGMKHRVKSLKADFSEMITDAGNVIKQIAQEVEECNRSQTPDTDESVSSTTTTTTSEKRTMFNQPPQLTQAEVECCMSKYEDTFDDYLEMFIQFGYVTLFSSAFPIAALCALVNNLMEIRTDAFKLCTNCQRPFGQRVENIGRWQDCMDVMGVIGVMVNCASLASSGVLQRLLPSLSVTDIILVVVVLEHVVIVAKNLIAYAIPDVPHWVATEMAKVEYNRRRALMKIEMATAKEEQEARRKSESENDSESSSPPDNPEILSSPSLDDRNTEPLYPIIEQGFRVTEGSTPLSEEKVTEL